MWRKDCTKLGSIEIPSHGLSIHRLVSNRYKQITVLFKTDNCVIRYSISFLLSLPLYLLFLSNMQILSLNSIALLPSCKQWTDGACVVVSEFFHQEIISYKYLVLKSCAEFISSEVYTCDAKKCSIFTLRRSIPPQYHSSLSFLDFLWTRSLDLSIHRLHRWMTFPRHSRTKLKKILLRFEL